MADDQGKRGDSGSHGLSGYNCLCVAMTVTLTPIPSWGPEIVKQSLNTSVLMCVFVRVLFLSEFNSHVCVHINSSVHKHNTLQCSRGPVGPLPPAHILLASVIV